MFLAEKQIKDYHKNGVIIIHRHKNSEHIFSPNIRVLEEKKYGISKIFFLSCLN